MKLKRPPQPLVFQYENVTALCTAVVQLYQCRPWQAALCLYRWRYYLSIGCALGRRQEARRVAGNPGGRCLGPCPVLYAYFEEHGLSLSRDAVTQLGGALHRRNP